MAKVLSARWLMVFFTTATVCICEGNGVKLSNQFYTVWGIIVAHYFSRSDRVQPTTGKEGNVNP